MPIIQEVISKNHVHLVDLNYELNNAFLNYMGASKPIYYASDITKTTNDKNVRLLEICKNFSGLTAFYDGKKAQNFIDTTLFAQNGIEMVFQDYQHTPYQQLWGGDFVPYMSIIDLLMNCGKKSKSVIMSSPLPDKIKRLL